MKGGEIIPYMLLDSEGATYLEERAAEHRKPPNEEGTTSIRLLEHA
jgi:hypothetical protein